MLSFRGTATVQDGLADVQIMHRDVHYMRDLFPGSRAHLGMMVWKQASLGPGAAASVASGCSSSAMQLEVPRPDLACLGPAV